MFQENDVKWFETYNTVKAQIVEHFNRTLKDSLYKYFTANDTKRWIGVLPDLIKMTPIETSKHPRKAWENLYGP